MDSPDHPDWVELCNGCQHLVLIADDVILCKYEDDDE